MRRDETDYNKAIKRAEDIEKELDDIEKEKKKLYEKYGNSYSAVENWIKELGESLYDYVFLPALLSRGFVSSPEEYYKLKSKWEHD